MVRRLRFRRRRPLRRRRRFVRRRRVAGYRRGRGVTYDGVYKAKCTILGSVQTVAGANLNIHATGWGMAPNAPNIDEQAQSPEFQALRLLWREYRVMGVKVTFIPAGNQTVAVAIAGTGGFIQGANFGLDKGSFQNMTVAQTAAIVQQDIVSCYDYKFTALRQKTSFYIKLSKYWNSISGQKWLQCNAAGNAQYYQPA